MYGMDTHTTVKTLLSNGISRRKIAEQLGIHRRVIKRIERGLASGSSRECYLREKKLAGFEQQIVSQKVCLKNKKGLHLSGR